MRPRLNLRARHAATALGALCLAVPLAALPGTARSDGATAGRAAVAADIAAGKSRLNVLAGRQASVHGRVLSGAAGRPVVLQRRSGQRWSTIDRATTRAGGGFSASPFARSTAGAPACASSATPRDGRSGGSTSIAMRRSRGTARACTATSSPAADA